MVLLTVPFMGKMKPIVPMKLVQKINSLAIMENVFLLYGYAMKMMIVKTIPMKENIVPKELVRVVISK